VKHEKEDFGGGQGPGSFAYSPGSLFPYRSLPPYFSMDKGEQRDSERDVRRGIVTDSAAPSYRSYRLLSILRCTAFLMDV